VKYNVLLKFEEISWSVVTASSKQQRIHYTMRNSINMMKYPLKYLVLLITVFNISFAIQADAKQPNIVLILADDLGWVDISSDLATDGHGSRYYQTPAIDQLASQGMSFTQAYALQNCAPTRSAILTGQYPLRHYNGVFNVGSLNRPDKRTKGYPDLPITPPVQNKHINSDSTSLHETLQSGGYITSFFGKNHGGGEHRDLTKNHGVDYNFGTEEGPFINGTVDGKRVKSGFFAIKDDKIGWTFSIPVLKSYANPYDAAYVKKVLEPIANGNKPALAIGTPKHLTDALGDAAVDFIKERAEGEKPFFLYIPFHAVHFPIVARPDLIAKYEAINSRDERHGKPVYAAMIELLDQNIRKVLNALDDPNGDGSNSDSLSSDTLVLFTSDNGGFVGPTNNSPLRGKKGMFYEGGIRVPFICSWPGVITPGTVNREAVHCIDIYPTLADVGQAPIPNPSVQNLDGETLAPILKGKKKTLIRDSLYWHFPGYMDNRQRPNSVIQKTIQGNDYKLFYYYETGQYELYNLTEDISESRNLLDGNYPESTPKIAEELNMDLRRWLIDGNAPTGTWKKDNQRVDYPSSQAF